MKKLLIYSTLMAIGALFYGGIEVLGRGYSHISMGVLGGMAFIMLHELNTERREGRLSGVRAALISAFFITACELLCGELLNRRFGMSIWNYSTLPFNFDGQICLLFSTIWFCLSIYGFAADELVRYLIFCESGPNLTGLEKINAE